MVKCLALRQLATLLGCACGVLAAGSVANATTYTVDSVSVYDWNQVTLSGTGYNGVNTTKPNFQLRSGCMSQARQQTNICGCFALISSTPLTWGDNRLV